MAFNLSVTVLVVLVASLSAAVFKLLSIGSICTLAVVLAMAIRRVFATTLVVLAVAAVVVDVPAIALGRVIDDIVVTGIDPLVPVTAIKIGSVVPVAATTFNV